MLILLGASSAPARPPRRRTNHLTPIPPAAIAHYVPIMRELPDTLRRAPASGSLPHHRSTNCEQRLFHRRRRRDRTGRADDADGIATAHSWCSGDEVVIRSLALA